MPDHVIERDDVIEKLGDSRIIRRSVLRYLRITFAAASLVACMLLIAFWVRSYSRTDAFRGWGVSQQGQLVYLAGNDPNVSSLFRRGWHTPWVYIRAQPGNYRIFRGFDLTRNTLSVPHWFPVLLTGTLAAVLGIRRPFQFSLRTLLITMTIIAVWLGLIVSLI